MRPGKATLSVPAKQQTHSARGPLRQDGPAVTVQEASCACGGPALACSPKPDTYMENLPQEMTGTLLKLKKKASQLILY